MIKQQYKYKQLKIKKEGKRAKTSNIPNLEKPFSINKTDLKNTYTIYRKALAYIIYVCIDVCSDVCNDIYRDICSDRKLLSADPGGCLKRVPDHCSDCGPGPRERKCRDIIRDSKCELVNNTFNI
jgi:hypothetical protein